MPRGPRHDAPGAVHHVMVRGIERSVIFRDDRDRSELLRRLCTLLPELGFLCFVFALMPNHFHLVVRSGRARLSRLMARLGTGYARYFNLRHERVGHLFQNRFRSRRVEDEADLLGLVLYVCRNPLEGGLVGGPDELARFPWGSASSLIGRRAPHSFEAIGETLSLFDTDRVRAREVLRQWLRAPVEGWAWEPPAEIARARATDPSPAASIEDLMREVCASYALSESDLRSTRRDRRIATARELIARRAAYELGIPGSQIANALRVSPSGVSRMLARAGRAAPERVN